MSKKNLEVKKEKDLETVKRDMDVFSHNLKLLRSELGLTQVQFAEKCSLSRSVISRIEAGENLFTDNITMTLIVDALDTTISDIFYEKIGVEDEN